MKKYGIIMLLLVLGLSSCEIHLRNTPEQGKTDNDSIDTRTPDQRRDLQYLFDIDAVPVITITLTQNDWNQYLTNFDNNPNTRQYVPAQFEFRKGEDVWTRDSIGLRPRGNTSRRRPEGSTGEMHSQHNPQWHHAHFGVRFTEYLTGERFFGMDRMVLKWFNNDPAYCREVYCYDLFRRFEVWSAPRASYCRLYIHVEGDSNPAYFGVYEMIEGVRSGYLADRRKEGQLPDDTGNLWKAAYNSRGIADLSDFNKTKFQKMGISDDHTDFSYSLKTNKKTGLEVAQQELYDFMEQMRPLPSGSDALKKYLEEHMYVDQFLRAMAVNVMVGMWDDYWVNGNNYYFYFTADHRFLFIPYDYDNTLGTDGLGVDPAKRDMLNWGSRGSDRMLIRKVLSIKEFESQYKDYIKQLAAGDFSKTKSQDRIRQWHKMIEPYVINDTNEDCVIYDEAAYWGNNYKYHLLSNDNNFFSTKINSIYW